MDLNEAQTLPKVSIVTPVYNAEEHLEECLDSLIGQSYQNLEIILVDDGSSDSSAEICDRYAQQDSRVVCYHNENHGPSYARNFGIEHATGEYLVFCDADDILAVEAVSKMQHVADIAHADLVISGYKRFGVKKTKPRILGSLSGSLITSKEQLAKLYLDTTTNMFGISIWAKMYRMSNLNDNNIRFDLAVNYEEDCLFNLDYFETVDVAVAVPEALYFYRQQEQSLSKGYREGSWQPLVNGYNARRRFVSQFDIPDSSTKIAYPFLVAFEMTAKKIYDSDLPQAKKSALYNELVSTPEIREMAQMGLTSKLNLRNALIRAIEAGNGAMVEDAFTQQIKRDKLKKNPLVRVAYKVKKKLS